VSRPLVVVGDALLDRDLTGRAERLAPDAPVPVVSGLSCVDRPGGAALAALLAGPGTVLVTALGADPAGERVAELLAAAGVRVVAGRLPGSTPCKERVRVAGQSLLRLDREEPAPGPPEVTPDMVAAVRSAGAVLVSDYGRGLTADPALREALAGLDRTVPVVWDPHPRGADPVPGVRLVTPNLSEALRAAGSGSAPGRPGAAAPGGSGPGAPGGPTGHAGPGRVAGPGPAGSGGPGRGPGPAGSAGPGRSSGPAGSGGPGAGGTPGSGDARGAGGSTVAKAARAARLLAERWRAGGVVVTLGAGGALLAGGDAVPLAVPAPPVTDAHDPCGAGDRFAATVAVRLAAGALPSEAVTAAVAAASAYVAAGGPASLLAPDGPLRRTRTAPAAGAPADAIADGGTGNGATAGGPASDGATADGDDAGQVVAQEGAGGIDAVAAVVARVRAAGGTVVATGGCFDILHAGHVATLQAARRLGDCLVVCVNSDESVRRLKGAGRPLVPERDRVRVLEALGAVDAVTVFGEDTPLAVLDRIRPDVWVKGGDYAAGSLPETRLLAGWGGEVVVVPYLAGRSTTGLVETARVTGMTNAGRQDG
jgi:D-beta-D-heptose 7-phosphate kinase / D-beta-D-heptose 1-phosphate adenosyltransferase